MPVDLLGFISSFTSNTTATTVTTRSEPTKRVDNAPTSDAKTTMQSVEYTQQASKAGLLVTDELDKAIERCKQRVDRIVKSCKRKNVRFRDIEFDLEEDQERCLHGLASTTRYTPADVLRVSQIFEKPQFVIDGATSSDIAQGQLGDCWFLSALATVSTVPDLVEKFCVARDEKVGVYGFIFYRDSGWVDVIIDDLLFVSIPKYEELTAREKTLFHQDKEKFIRQARRGSKSLYFAKSGTENETWVPLVEKAYAKLHGDYAAIDGGQPREAVEDMMGAVSTVMHPADILDTDRFWNEELMLANKDRLFGCYTTGLANPADSLTPANKIDGLYTGHAYSVIKCVEHNGRRFLRIRNPWGESEWTGRWADGSREWQGEWLEPETLEKLGHRFGDDGEFIMEYDDFLQTWPMIERSRLFDVNWRMSSLWLNVKSLPPPSAWTFGDVSFTFSVSKPTSAVIVLAQLDSRYFSEISGYSYWSLEFVLFKKDESEPLAESGHTSLWGRSVNLEIDLDEGDYVVQVRLDRWRFRQKGYFTQGMSTWDWRKLARVWSEAALSRSIASNYQPEADKNMLPFPLENLGGKDLTRIELDKHAAIQREREELRAKVQSKPASSETTTVTTIQEKTEIASATVLPDSAVAQPLLATSPESTPSGSSDSAAAAEAAPKKEDDVAKATKAADAALKTGDTATMQMPAKNAPQPIHLRFSCDGCKMDPIVGVMYHCMHADCRSYDLCSTCIEKGLHPKSHRFIRAEEPQDMDDVHPVGSELDDEDDVVLGLRVYTHRDAAATIAGQLRHGRVIAWSKEN
ncbi:cysteine proteinase [Exidia glandulosa HHB12029]|uniref:Cysteine proteinase n=1 Tax=Exidia glandulosa HHB12029 TaxID=1314781 RepID=A0A166BC22_EXIGL|nr:cysteine proteinase [Exidia glandulosa HHB12029]